MIGKIIRVLLVEDNPTDALLLEDALADVESLAVEVTRAQRLSEALEKLSQASFDVVLCDLGLPDSQGLDTFRRLHAADSAVPILVLTGFDDDPTGLRAIQEGAQDYLIKGQMNGHALTRIIRYSIERKQSAVALRESQRFLQSTLNALSSHIAVLGEDGSIVAINRAWERFAAQNEGSPAACGVGANYLDACENAKGDWIDGAAEVARGIREVIGGERSVFRLEYPCHSPSEQRWFNLRVTRFDDATPVRVVVAHENITERKLAAEKMMQLAHAVEQSPVSIVITDSAGSIEYVNHKFTELTGYIAEEVLGQNPRVLNSGQTLPQTYKDMWETLEAGRLWQGEFINRKKNGELFREWASISPLHNHAGKITHYIAIKEDITERKKAEEELQESNEKFQLLVNNITDTFWIRSPDMVEQYYLSPSFKEMWGIPIETQYSTPHIWSEFIVPEDRERVQAEFAMLMQDTPSIDVEYRIKRPDKEIRWVRSRGYQVRNDAGELIRLAGIVSDITGRKQLEAAKSELQAEVELQRHRLHTIVATVPGVVWESQGTDTQHVDFVSDYIETMLGYTVTEWLATPNFWLTIVHPDDKETAAQIAASQFASDQGGINQFRCLTKDGGVVWVESQSVNVHDEAGRVVGMRGVTIDISERKQAEESLRASEERFQNIVANVPGVVYQFALHPDGSVEIPFVNDGCRELFEMEPEEIQRLPDFLTDMIHPDDLAENKRLVAESARNLTPWQWEGRFQLSSGETKWVQGISQPHRLPDGGTLWDGLLLDITARKEAEIERDRFFTLSIDLLGITGSNGYFKSLNPAFETTLGFSTAELMATPLLEFVHPDDLASTQDEMAKLAAGETVVQFENRYRCRDGSYKWLQWMSVPFEDLWYFAARDITEIKNTKAALLQANDELEKRVRERTGELSTANAQLQSEMIERRRADEALYKNHEFLQAVLESTADGIVACDAAGELTLFNRATREFHGLPLETLPAEKWPEYYSLYLPDGVTPMQKDEVPLFRALDGERISDIEMVIAPDAGSTRLVTNNGGPLFDADGAKLGAVVVMHDITQSRLAQVELRRAKEEADTANRAKSEFLSRMSHELRTPLNAILGFGQILERQELAPLAKESVVHILSGGRHLLDLINEVLDISRVEAGRLEVSLQPVALADIVPAVCALMRPLADERQLRLIENAPSLCRCHVLADDQRLRQVLINLLSNAIKYNREGGEVEVSCTPLAGNRISIAVRDSGTGVAPEDIPKLFTPFERLGAANSQIEGTGLGLPLAKHLVSVMGGTLNVESVVGSGSTFTIELPQAAPIAGTEKTPEEALREYSAPPAAHTYCVLCIEDNPANLRLMETIFEERPDIAFLPSIQGSIGLELALRHEPDLILLDLNLPDIHGSEVLARLQNSAITRDIPVIIVSSEAAPRQKEQLLSAGAKAYLTKPIDLQELLQTLNNFLTVGKV